MSILLFCVGAVVFVVGGAMIGFGIPINEFSFGNTLIGAGATAAVGGLIVVGLGAVVSKLQQIADILTAPVPIRPGRPLDMYEAAGGSSTATTAPGRIPFPPKPAGRAPQPLEPRAGAPAPGQPIEEQAVQSFAPTFAPTLRNPDEPPVTVEAEEVSLSPRQPMAASPLGVPDDGEREQPEPPVDAEKSASTQAGHESPLDVDWRAPPSPPQDRPPSTDFDTMWPPEIKSRRAATVSEAKPEPERDLPPPGEAAATEPREEPEAPPPAGEPHAVAILKSGVVDGMAYTLYVDGSIEAEMPQGTLRFASINELRDYLESNS